LRADAAQRLKTRKVKIAAKKAPRSNTTRSTAGPGFDFEDSVAAWLLLKALSGQPLPSIDGVAARPQMQVDALGWHIDDILLAATASADDARRLAISCRGNSCG
jgi:hypothetical protein